MVGELRRFGLFDDNVFPTIFDLLSSLGALIKADDVLYFMDSRILTFFIKDWVTENPDEFDTILALRVYGLLKNRLTVVLDVNNPPATARRVRYYRDLDVPSLM